MIDQRGTGLSWAAGRLVLVGGLAFWIGACPAGREPSDEDAGTEQPPPNPGCLDEDGDGAGLGDDCARDDCDDTDPALVDECGQDCGANPDRKGCACAEEGAVVPCYRGPAGTAGVGGCSAGLAHCRSGAWEGCEGQRLPHPESCDGFDDDCDGVTDDGALSECGTCGPCESSCVGAGEECSGWVEEDLRNLVETGEGWLTLGGNAMTLHVIWPSSATEGKVFRVDTRTREVLGAYWTGTGHEGEWATDSPSRTAVDDRGNVVIANRYSNDGRSSFTKVAANPDDCPDRNGNGRIDTSTGWDDLLAFDDIDDWEDECILWHTPLPASGARPIALYRSDVIDGGSDLGWACAYDNMRCYQFEQETGELTGEEVDTPGVNPYGGALDREGWFWIVGGPIGRFQVDDPEGTWELIAGNSWSYIRMIIDENNVPWFTGDDLYRYDRDAEELVAAHLDRSVGHVASDGEGSIWVATYSQDALVFRVDNDEEMQWRHVETPDTITFGIAVDFDRQVWTFGYPNGEGWGSGGSARVIGVETEEVEHVLHDCGGTDCVAGPYVRGDITGLQRTNALDPAGEWTGVFEGCAGGETTWHQVRIDADTPPGTSITVSARTAASAQGLAGAPVVPLGVVPVDGDAFPLAFPEPGAFVRVDLRLATDEEDARPALKTVSVDHGCPPVIE